MSRIWFVTGASRGLGRCVVEAALEADDRVVATARRPEALKDQVRRWGDRALPLKLDVTRPEDAQRAVAEALAKFGRIDVLVNNAGKADFAAIEDCTEESFRMQVETVFLGVVHVTKAVLPVFREQGAGHFVQVSSAGDRLGTPGLAAYQSSKWAVLGFSTTLAAEVAPLGIRVTILEPGTMRTDMPGGSSMEFAEVSPPYAPTVGVVADRLRRAFRDAPNEPERAARLVVDLARMPEPPTRLLVGSDALAMGMSAAREVIDNDVRWERSAVR